MNRRLLVKLTAEAADAVYSWRWADESSAERGDIHALSAAVADRECELWLLVPGARVLIRELHFSRKEQRHMRNLAPFQVEDDLAGELDDVHFAFGAAIDGQVPLACVDKPWLEAQFAHFAEAGLEVNRCLPEMLLLPGSAQRWTLRLGTELQLRRATGDSFAVSEPLARTALAALQAQLLELPEQDNKEAGDEEQQSTLPDELVLQAESEAALERLAGLLPGGLNNLGASRVERQVVDGWDYDLQRTDVIDLCQGDFSRRLPLQRWWQQWRAVAAVAVAVLVAFAAVNIAELQSLKAQQAEQRRAIQTVYRRVVPKGAMVDAERQLSQKAKSFQSGGEVSSRLLPMLAAVTPALAGADGVALRTLNYSDDKNELRINIQAPAFNVIEQLRGQLNGKGLQATLDSSTARGDQHQARLRIRRSGS
mgnify:CR=1 FL=1